MTQHGVCSYLYDPDKHLKVTAEWVADIKAIHPDLCVRVPIRADALNNLDLPAYLAAELPYRQAGVPIYHLIDQDFNRPWLEATPRHIYPNEPLGYQGNKRQNPWIKDTCVRAGKAAKILGGKWIVGNEPNLQGHLAIGANVPPVPTDKGPAMAPECFYSFGFECGGWLHANGAEEVILGSLSWLSTAGDDDLNPYCGGYMKAGLQYAHDTGVRQWPVSALSANCEGAWTLSRALAMKAEIAHITGLFGISLPLHIGEWSWQNGDVVDPARAQQTFNALTTVADVLFFFQHPSRTPLNPKDYGLRLWEVQAGGFCPAYAPMPWYAIYRELLDGSLPAGAT